MVPLLLARVIDGKISLQSVIEKTSFTAGGDPGHSPCRVSVSGTVRILPCTEKFPRPVTPEMLHSKCGWTPFEGHLALFPATVIMGR